MSVIVTLLIDGDPSRLEEYAAANAESMQAIVAQAAEHGLIAHRFYGSGDNRLMVIDEWPDAESFQAFFAAAHDRIGPLMQGAGVTAEPQVSFWRKLEAHDDFGWGA